jgi:hypothetical protein
MRNILRRLSSPFNNLLLLLHNLLPNRHHGVPFLRPSTILLDLLKHDRVDILVDRPPHHLSHHAPKHPTIEVDLLHAVLEVCRRRDRRVVARVDVGEDGVANKVPADFAVQVKGVHRVMDVEGEFEGGRRGAEESVREDEGFWVIDVVLVDSSDDDFSCTFVDAEMEEELGGLEAAFGWEPEVAV